MTHAHTSLTTQSAGQEEVLDTIRMLEASPVYTKARPGGGGRLQLLCVPLYAALSSADQMQAFAPTARNSRKVLFLCDSAVL